MKRPRQFFETGSGIPVGEKKRGKSFVVPSATEDASARDDGCLPLKPMEEEANCENGKDVTDV